MTAFKLVANIIKKALIHIKKCQSYLKVDIDNKKTIYKLNK